MTAMETRDTSAIAASLNDLRGVLVLGPDGKQIAASGIALQAEMASCIVAAWQDARRRQRRLFTMDGPDGHPVVVVVLPSSDATVLVAMERDSRDALFEFVGAVDFAGDILAHFLTNPFEARAGTRRR
jgi:hypothetical protein